MSHSQHPPTQRMLITMAQPDTCPPALPAAGCRRWQGEAIPQEGQQVAWVEAGALQLYDMPPADIPLIPQVLAAMEQARQGQGQQEQGQP